MILTLLAQCLLFLWFLGCTVSYRTRKWVLVEGMGLKSYEFGMLCFFTAGVILYHTCYMVGKWFLLTVLTVWAVVQFFCHWYYTLFGVSPQKLKGYNECFRDTVKLFPSSETRLLPDLYHVILHALILWNLVTVLVRL